MMTNHNNNKTNNNNEQAQDKTAWHSKLLTAGTKFGNEDRITKKKSIKFGLQFAPCLHKVIRKMFRSAKIKAPLKEVDKFFGNSLYKNETTLHDENLLDLLDKWFIASIVFYVKSKQGLNKLKYAFKQQVKLNKRASNKFDGKNEKIANIKTIFTLSKDEYAFLYKRIINGFQLHLATKMDPIPISRPSSRPSSSNYNKQKNVKTKTIPESKKEDDDKKIATQQDEPPMAGGMNKKQEDDDDDNADDEIDPTEQIHRNLIVFSEMTESFLQNCVNTDWQNDRDEIETISKIRIYSLLHEIVVYSIIGRKRMTPSKIKETLNMLFELCFPELKDEANINLIKLLDQRRRERLKIIKQVQEYSSPFEGKMIKRHYPKPWNVQPVNKDELMRRRIEYAIRKGESLDKFKSTQLLSAIGDKNKNNESWVRRRVVDVKKTQKRGIHRLNSSIKRSGGLSAANTRAEYYQIRDANADDQQLLILPPPFRPPFSGQSSWVVAFGRSRPATAGLSNHQNNGRNNNNKNRRQQRGRQRRPKTSGGSRNNNNDNNRNARKFNNFAIVNHNNNNGTFKSPYC